MQELTFERERAFRKAGFDVVVGVDEAGRGPLAGPVVACATTVRNVKIQMPNVKTDSEEEKLWKFVRDSKTLSEKQREKMYEFVQEHFFVGVGIVYPETIDRINILEATFLAMKESIGELKRRIANDGLRIDAEKTMILVDGNMTIPNLSLPQEAIVDGDALVRSIAAASIIAKVTRDRMMLGYDKEYPVYGFAKHKGYGTKVHMDALRKYGPSPIHRMSFKPVYYSLPENVNRNLLPNGKRKR
jgi:ribonuclease HII